MKGRGQAGFTIPVTMLMVSVLMVLSTAIVAMTVASFRDAARTRNRAEILNVSEIGLKLAIAEIMPGLGTLPNAYWSFATKSVDPAASASVSAAAPPVPGPNSKDLTHEFQLFANVRNWSPFADWSAWTALGSYPGNVKTDGAKPAAYPEGTFRAWTNGWWPVPRNTEYDDSYFAEDASVLGGKAYPNPLPGKDTSENWFVNNPEDDDQLAFPVRLGTSSVPVQNLYWYWLTEIEPNTPTNTQLRSRGLVDPYWVNTPPRFGPPIDAHPRAQRDVGIGAWPNRREYSDGVDSAILNYDKGSTDFSLRADRYNFLNTPVLKKIYMVDHRGTKIRVAVYARMILREYFIDSAKSPADYPDDFLSHMRTERPGGGPNVIFYLVAVNESTLNQRGVRVQQAIYVPMGPANPQDIDATLKDSSDTTRFSTTDGIMMPGTVDLLMDKQLMAGATISGRLLPASGDFSYRVPTTQAYTNNPNDVAAKANVNSLHPHWVYLIEWNGLGPLLADFGGESYLSTNSALIWRVPGSNQWRRTPFRDANTNAARITGPVLGVIPPAPAAGNGATPSAFADAFGRFEIGHVSDIVTPPEAGPLLTAETRWRGPGEDAWGRVGHRPASMSYILTTELQIPDQGNSNARYSRPVNATRSNLVIAPTPAP
jgi:hypothetical protein